MSVNCKDKEKNVLYESGDWSNQRFSCHSCYLCFYRDLKEKKLIKRMGYVHKIGKNEHIKIHNFSFKPTELHNWLKQNITLFPLALVVPCFTSATCNYIILKVSIGSILIVCVFCDSLAWLLWFWLQICSTFKPFQSVPGLLRFLVIWSGRMVNSLFKKYMEDKLCSSKQTSSSWFPSGVFQRGN